MCKSRVLLLVAAVLLAGAVITAQPPQGAPAQGVAGRGRGGRSGRPAGRKVVLAWADTRNGIAQHDSTSHALATIERLGYESGLYDTYIRTDSEIISHHPLTTTGQPASGGPSLSNVDAIFFMGHREVPINDQQKKELLAFVHDEGKGFVAAHTATTAFESWPEFNEMIGGQFDQHPYGVASGTIVNEDPNFPATRQFPLTFPFTDEFYQTKNFSRDKIRVLLRLDMSKMPSNPGVHRTDGDFPLAWARMYGKGRVFYSALGHASSTWDIAEVYQMYFEAIKWALGLTDADVAPRPLPGAAQTNSAQAK
ncbi:MAG TPA: ThuA domain-containing protein [Bryobacteraceae bacterium]|nr:ThuA domain-containing protein [Bryobacteraceae bacterium]